MKTEKLAFEKFGTEGHPLVILHGLFGSGSNWRTFANKFADTYQIWTVDLRNHGNSPHSKQMNYEVMASDIFRFLDDHQLQTVTLLGHSMGGKTAMLCALQQPDRISQLIVGDIAPVAYAHAPQFLAMIDAMLSIPLHAKIHRADVQRSLQAVISNFQVLSFLLKN